MEINDHRIIGKELDLFSFNIYAPAMLFSPKRRYNFKYINQFSKKEHQKRNYVEIITPQIMSEELWKISGHADYYEQNMFSTNLIGHEEVTEEEKSTRKQFIKPMNCPGCILYYKTKIHSYNEFPLKIAEFGKVLRQELSGASHGLFRVRAFTQDDAHIFCNEDQLENQILEILNFIFEVYQIFNFSEINLELSTRPEKFVGEIVNWDFSENILQKVLNKSNKQWKLNPGDGAFYGPKFMDLKLIFM